MRVFNRTICLMILCLAFALPLSAERHNGTGDYRHHIEVELHKSRLQRTDLPITRISITDPEIANYHLITPTQFLVLATKNPGRTDLIVWHGDDRAEIYEVEVFIPGDLIGAINQRIRQLAPGAQVTVLPGNKGVMLVGEVVSQGMLERVLTILKGFDVGFVNLVSVTGSQQVQLEVKIAEVSRSGAKKMGLGFLIKDKWSIGLIPSGGASGSASASNSRIPETTFTETASDGTTSQFTTSGGLAQSLSSEMELLAPFGSAFQLVLHGLNDDFLSIISLLKSQGLAQMLATPTLVTMSGQEAEFLVGGEFPIPISGGFNDTSIEFKRYGIILRFTPFVTGEETITIRVSPEVSSPDFSLAVFSGGVSVPGLKTRRGSTTLQLRDGQTFIMAGLLKEDLRTTVNKLPFLGDIPILGTLFTSKEFQKDESELMVMVTPRLVRPLNPDEVPTVPGMKSLEEFRDTDFFLKNRPPGYEDDESETEEATTEAHDASSPGAIPPAGTPKPSGSAVNPQPETVPVGQVPNPKAESSGPGHKDASTADTPAGRPSRSPDRDRSGEAASEEIPGFQGETGFAR